jgi:hypothetical protein
MDSINVVITHTMLGIEDHGILTAFVHLRFDGNSCQGFGGYGLGAKDANYCGHFIRRVLDVVGVREWEQLVGKNVRIRRSQGLIRSIGNIIDDVWFTPAEEFKTLGG